MAVKDVSGVAGVAARCRVDEAGIVAGSGELHGLFRIKLGPGLVERHPYQNAGVLFELGYDFSPFLVICSLCGFCERIIPACVVAPFAPLAAGKIGRNRGHILPYGNPQAVTVVVPACRLNLDVLADHVVAKVPGLDYVIFEGLVRGGGIEAVWPPALVQRAKLEIRLSVEPKALETVGIYYLGRSPYGSITAHLVLHLATLYRLDFKRIEIGRLGAPEPCRRDFKPQGLSGSSFCRCNQLSGFAVFGVPALGPFKDVDLYGICLFRCPGGDCEAVLCCHRAVVRDIGIGNRFNPDALPDAGDGGVPDTAGPGNLLAAGLFAVVGSVKDLHYKFLFALYKVGGYVVGESGIAASVLSKALPVEPDLALPVHRIEVQQHLLPRTRNGERTVVPEGLIGTYGPAHPGKGRLYAERHQNLPVGLLRPLPLCRCHRILPKPVQGLPVLPYHLRTRILRMCRCRTHLIGPRRTDMLPRRPPFNVLRTRRHGRQRHQD